MLAATGVAATGAAGSADLTVGDAPGTVDLAAAGAAASAQEGSADLTVASAPATGGVLYFVDNTNDFLRAWSPDGTRQTAGDLDLGSGDWGAATATDDRLYAVDQRDEFLRAYDHSGTAVPADDIDLGSGSWRGAAATSDRIYALDNTANFLRAYDHSGTAVPADDIDLGSGSWAGATATADRIFVLLSTTRSLIAYDHSGARRSGDDISLDGVIWQGVTATADRIFVVENLDNFARAWDHAGARQADDDIDLVDSNNWQGAAFVPGISAGSVSLAAAGVAATGGAGSANLTVVTSEPVAIGAVGTAAAAQAGSADLIVRAAAGSLMLAAAGVSATGGSGSARLIVVTRVPVMLAASGAPATGRTGSARLIVVDVPLEIAATGRSSTGRGGSSDLRVRDPAPDPVFVVASRPAPTVQVLLRDRRTWRPIAVLDRWTSVRFTERWREAGEGMIAILADDLPSEADAALVTGQAAVDVTVRDVDDFGEAIVDGMVGPVTAVTLADGDFVRLHLPFAQIRNEIAAEGKEATAGLPATRPARRVFSAASQAAYGCREEYVDARQADTPADLTGVAAIRLAERVGLDLEATAGGEISGRGFSVQIAFTDALGILRARHVDATGVAAVQNPGATAGEYIAGLLEDNLLAPSIDRRAADFAARLHAGTTVIGEDVHLPLRWPTLADAVRDIGIAGLVGLRATLEGDEIEYRVTPLRDRTARTGDRTAVVTNVVDIRYRIEPGDLVTVAPWIRRNAAGPAVELTQVCSARTFAAAPGQALTIRPTLGEPASIARLLLAESRRNQPARTS